MSSHFFFLLFNLLFTLTPSLGAPSKSIGIIGAGGFIGSELFQHLNKSPDRTLFGYDHDPQVLLNQIEESNGRNIPTHQLHKFDVVIYLGGCTGRKACATADSDESVYASNVQAVVDIATRMTSSQTLIFASSSAVVDHRKDCTIPVTEKSTDSFSLLHDVATFDTLDRYTKHMILRETALLELVEQFGKQVPKLIGLRFGTVGGVSVSQRVDLLTNAIIRAAYTKGVITGVGQDKHRPVLWLSDALRAIETIIDTDNDTTDRERFRIYHLSSFNTKIGKAVMEAGRITGAGVQIIAPPTPEDGCGFSLDVSLFCKDFNFTFAGNLAIVLENIDNHVPISITAQGTHQQKERHYEPTHQHHNHYTDALSPLNIHLKQKLQDGITDELFYTQFNAKSQLLKTWLNDRITSLRNAGYKIGGYGAAAKGMVMLNFLQGHDTKPTHKLEFVVDDAVLKENTFTLSTGIPVVSYQGFRTLAQEYHTNSSGLALIIFEWNFWEEISKQIVSQLSGIDGLNEIVCLLPFPQAKVVRLTLRGNDSRRIPEGPLSLSTLQFPMTCLPNSLSKLHAPKRKQVMLITHFYNEEILLPYWIRHHASMFDHAILIDYRSTDSSRKIIEDLAPSTWRVVSTQAPRFTVEFEGHDRTASLFSASQCDSEVAEWELKYPNDWHIALTMTEFLVANKLRSWLAGSPGSQKDDDVAKSFVIPSLLMTGSDAQPLDRFASLISQRTQYTPRSHNVFTFTYDRLMHTGFKTVSTTNTNTKHVYSYTRGRHFGYLSNSKTAAHAEHYGVQPHKYTNRAVILKYLWTPWPENNHRPGGRWKRELEAEKNPLKWLPNGLHTRRKNNGVLSANQHDLQDLHIGCANNFLSGVVSCSLHQVFHESVVGSQMGMIQRSPVNEVVECMQSHDLSHVAGKNGIIAPKWMIMDLNVSITVFDYLFDRKQMTAEQLLVLEPIHVEIAPPYDSLAVHAAVQRFCLSVDQNIAMNEICEQRITQSVVSSFNQPS